MSSWHRATLLAVSLFCCTMMRRLLPKSAARGDAQLTVVYISVSFVAFSLVMMLWFADHHAVDPLACQSVCDQQLASRSKLPQDDHILQCPKCSTCPQCPACPEAQSSSWFSSNEKEFGAAHGTFAIRVDRVAPVNTIWLNSSNRSDVNPTLSDVSQ